MEMQLDQQAYQNICDHARETFPNECCGFFYGKEEDGNRVITHTLKINNSMEGDQRDKFEINASDYRYGEKYAEQNNLQLLGIYHSHPNHPAIPSEFDLNRAMPFFSYILVSLDDHKILAMKSWQLGEKFTFEEEKVNIEVLQKKSQNYG